MSHATVSEVYGTGILLFNKLYMDTTQVRKGGAFKTGDETERKYFIVNLNKFKLPERE